MSSENEFELRTDPLALEPLFRLAARLGVEPLAADQCRWVVVTHPDGRRLDPLALVNALLDRLDRVDTDG